MNAGHSHLKALDCSVVQQCMHCGLCLPMCPTYAATKLQRISPRGRIALMRSKKSSKKNLRSLPWGVKKNRGSEKVCGIPNQDHESSARSIGFSKNVTTVFLR